MPLELAPGIVIAGRYRLDRHLGQGGMGVVWMATQIVTKRPVALKLLKASEEVHRAQRERFLREARAASAVRHPNVVQIHDVVDVEGELPAIVMELLVGTSLKELLERRGKLTLGEAARVFVDVANAVDAAHMLGIVHRDLKPDNVFLHRGPSGLVEVRVLDFGIAKVVPGASLEESQQGLTETGAMLGTPLYMSPEQVFGDKTIDARSDVWSFGIMLYQALSGVLPTRGPNFGQIFKTIVTKGSIRPLREVAPELPAAVTDLVDRMLQIGREERPERLREVRDRLADYASSAPIDLPPTSAEERAWRAETLTTGDALVSAEVEREGETPERPRSPSRASVEVSATGEEDLAPRPRASDRPLREAASVQPVATPVSAAGADASAAALPMPRRASEATPLLRRLSIAVALVTAIAAIVAWALGPRANTPLATAHAFEKPLGDVAEAYGALPDEPPSEPSAVTPAPAPAGSASPEPEPAPSTWNPVWSRHPYIQHTTSTKKPVPATIPPKSSAGSASTAAAAGASAAPSLPLQRQF